jgi:hypothetical protein
MTRFKELRRIEAALKHHDRSELLWAERYCLARGATGKSTGRRNLWGRTLKQVRSALREQEGR